MSEFQNVTETTTDSDILKNFRFILFKFSQNLCKDMEKATLENCSDIISHEAAARMVKDSIEYACCQSTSGARNETDKEKERIAEDIMNIERDSHLGACAESNKDRSEQCSSMEGIKNLPKKQRIQNPPLRKCSRRGHQSALIGHKTRESRRRRTLRARSKAPMFRDTVASSPHIKSPRAILGYARPWCWSIGVQNNAENVRQHICSKHPGERMPSRKMLADAAIKITY